MEGPGMSLFQGAASIHINNSAQDRLEEQEEIEDQKRRNEELKHKLANAFDDLLDDDEASSVNSSGNFTLENTPANGPLPRTGRPPTYIESLSHLKEHASESPKPYTESPKQYCETPKNHMTHGRHQEEPVKLQFSPYGAGDGQNNYFQQELRGHMNGVNNYDARQEYMNNEKMKVMYEMRINECQQLASRAEKLDTEIDALRARLAAAINDRDKAELSLQEAHHLLASSKHKTIELEQQVSALTDKLAESDQERDQMRMELRSSNISLQDVQQRLQTLQVAHTHDTDNLFREQQDRHRQEMDRLQNDLMKAKNRLDEKENEIKTLERRCMERDKEKEDILVEKGATINRLARELEAAQSRLVGGETVRLKERAAQLCAERNAAKEQVKELGCKLEVTTHELVLCRNKLGTTQREHELWRTTLHQILVDTVPDTAYIVLCRNKLGTTQREHELWRATLHQILVDTVPDTAYIGDAQSPGKLTTLKEVLSHYKVQLQKLPTLQEEISKRDKKIEQHRKLESEYRAKLEEQRGAEMQLSARLAALQRTLDALSDAGERDACARQNEQLTRQLEDARAQLKALDLKYTELEMEHDKLRASKGSRAATAQEASADLLRELERCSAQRKDTLHENAELNNLYLQACSARDAVNRELKDVTARTQLEREHFNTQERDYVERMEKYKQQIEKLNSELTSCRSELETANRRISELQREFTDKQKEFTEKLDKYLKDEKSAMRKEMEPCMQCERHLKNVKYLDEQLSKCTVRLASQESNEALMSELKSKAEFFQQYIVDRFKKLQEQKSVGTNTEDVSTSAAPRSESIEHMVQDCDDVAAKTAMMMKEKAIREQIAEKFTLEIKTIEMNCARRIKEIESEQLDAVAKLKELLERKAQEVETLKQFIIAERNKVTQILESKEKEISELIKEHNDMQADCQKAKDLLLEWKVKAEKYKERASRLGSLEDALKSEREDWKQKNSSCSREYQAMKVRVTEMQSKLAQMEEIREKLQMDYQLIQDKYRHAKKTIMTYKEYITKKDTHVNSEMNRIQDEYRKIFVKLQNQINYQVNCRIQQEKTNEKPSHSQAQSYHQTDVSERLSKLNEEIARLAQSNFNHEQDS